ncbi:MAG TPA: hypothetical protein VEA36_03500 [Candidatus Paceibacterota bacterium]|nr:hypothetical protein [Candidatus Paceibacterota bacterium]
MGFLERLGLGVPTPEDRARLQQSIDANHEAEANLAQAMRHRGVAVGKLDLLPEYRERTRLEIALQQAETKLNGARDRVAHLDELRRLRTQLAAMRGQTVPADGQEAAAARAELATEQAAYDSVKTELDRLNVEITQKESRL